MPASKFNPEDDANRTYNRCERLNILWHFLEIEAHAGNHLTQKKILEYLNNSISPNTLTADMRLMLPLYGMDVYYDRKEQGFLIRENTDTNADNNETLIQHAIEIDRQISFSYFHYELTQKRARHKTYSKSGDSFKVSPYFLYHENGNIYIKCYLEEKDRFQTFRLDRIEDLKCNSRTPRVGKLKWEEEYKKSKQFKIFNSYGGEAYKITLLCQNWLIDYVMDEFGTQNPMIVPQEDGKHFKINVGVELSPPFFAWLTSFQGKITIVFPDPAIDEMQKFLKRSTNKYSVK